MNIFPLFQPLEPAIASIINSAKVSSFSGATPFVIFQHDNGGNDVIGDVNSYLKFNNFSNERFPPIVQSFNVAPAGSMGVIRQGEISIKFASKKQIEDYRNFFRLGSPKIIHWGWNKDANGKSLEVGPIDLGSAKKYADNIKSWQNFCASKNYAQDVLVGPLMDFDITMNPDATIDVTFKVGSKNEIPAFLGNSSQTQTDLPSTKDNKNDSELARLLFLNKDQFSGLKASAGFNQNVINYAYSETGFHSILSDGSFFDNLSNSVQKWTGIGQTYDSFTEDVFVSLKWVIDYTVNKRASDKNDYKVNIDKAIGVAHPKMISADPDVMFPNWNAFTVSVDIENQKLLLSNKPQSFSIVDAQHMDYVQKTPHTPLGENGPEFAAGHWGYIKNIFISVKWLNDTLKTLSLKNTKDFLEQICNKVNVASAGLMDLIPQEHSPTGDKTVYTIVDYALTPRKAPSPPTIHLFGNPFSHENRIINVAFKTDLPKEIISMAMLGKTDNARLYNNIFFDFEKGPHDILNIGTSNDKDNIAAAPTPASGSSSSNNNEQEVVYGESEDGVDYAKKQKEKEKIAFIDENCAVLDTRINKNVFTNNKGGGIIYCVKSDAILREKYFGPTGVNQNNPLLPIDLDITILGVSGITIGKLIKVPAIDMFGLSGILQIVEVSHSIQNNVWETTIKAKYRPNN